MRECDLVFRAYLLSDDNFTIASLPMELNPKDAHPRYNTVATLNIPSC